MKILSKKEKGAITALILAFSIIFLILLSGISVRVASQLRSLRHQQAYEKALTIAEAGVEYYRWHLAHAPEDYQDGTGQPGPYIHDYKDPEGNVIGKFSLQITPPNACRNYVEIESTGWTLSDPEVKRTVRVRYAKEALAKFSFLTNDDVWFGEDEELKGPFHSNGGIRMDGEQNSLSTSAKETYICQIYHGCFPPQEKPGIWGEGEGGDKGLWKFPVPAVDFDKITQDLAFLKTEAQDNGIYLPPSMTQGYHLHFNSDGTVDVYKVTRLRRRVWGFNGERWVYESNSISRERHYAKYNLPSNCAPIFVEDNLWVDGTVNGRVTVVAARLPDTPQTNAKIIIWGDIDYATSDSVLALIAQKDILIPLYSPDRLEIKAVLLAQKGHVFRYYYPHWWFEPYRTYAIRDYIETYGSIITNTVWTFTWVDWRGNVISGYRETEMMYDSNLTYNPPPYFPTYGEYKVILWEEVE